jgi:broad specificity phosphatase PhoE
MKLFLLRHGEAVKNADDTILTDFGRQEAKALASKLSELPIDKIFVSDYTRSIETLEPFRIMNPDIPIVKTSDLREIYRVIVGGPGREGTPIDRLIKDSERATKVWEILKKEKGNVAVFCHGNIIRFFLMKSLNINSDNLWDKMLITTGSISVIEVDGDLIRVNAINLIDHSPLKKKFYERERTNTTYQP